MSNEMTNHTFIECPFCGGRPVFATVLTTFSFVSEHVVLTSGVDMNGDSAGEIIGEPNIEPILRITRYRCTSCKKNWVSNLCKLVKNENGLFSFVKVE